jgi:alpha-N-arabinofuranosidase
VVNRHEANAIETTIELQSGTYTGKAAVSLINAETVDARNSRTEQPVKIQTEEVSFKGNTIRHSFPAHSFTQMEIPLK